MNLDAVAERAARAMRDTAMRDTADLDTNMAIDTLRRFGRRRTALRGVGAVTIVLVAAAWGLQLSGDSGHDRPEPSRSIDFPPLDEGYDVIASAVSPSGMAEAVATYREGQTAVVIVRTLERTPPDVVWSAPTPHELGDRNVPFPTAVDWAPDGSRIAILVGQEQGAVNTTADPVELTLVTANPDGTARQSVAEVGRCRCADTLPTLTWSGDQVEVDIPDGPDRGRYTREMP
jgi:hypothetical protein